MPSPDIYFFNPTCDFAVGNNSFSWQPNANLRRMEYDLDNIMQFLAHPNDLIAVQKLPSDHLLSLLKKAGFNMAEYRKLSELEPIFQIGKLRPWGWSPAAHKILEPFKPFCSGDFLSSPVAEWTSQQRELYSRRTSGKILTTLLSTYPNQRYISENCLPQICKSIGEVEIIASYNDRLMVKLPWSSSGRGLLPITRFPLHVSVRQRLSGMLKDQGEVIAEPLLNKAADIGFLYEVTPNGAVFQGISRFFTDKTGRYKGNYLKGYSTDISEDILRLINELEINLPEIHINVLNNAGIEKLYQGPLGIDTLIFKNNDGEIKVNPLLEINFRYTMGHIAMNLEKHISPRSWGIFAVFYAGGSSFSDFVSQKLIANPLKIKNKKIVSGFLPLTDFNGNSIFGAYMEVFS